MFKKYGELGKVIAEESGRAVFRMMNPTIKVWDIIGRSMMLHSQQNRYLISFV